MVYATIDQNKKHNIFFILFLRSKRRSILRKFALRRKWIAVFFLQQFFLIDSMLPRKRTISAACSSSIGLVFQAETALSLVEQSFPAM